MKQWSISRARKKLTSKLTSSGEDDGFDADRYIQVINDRTVMWEEKGFYERVAYGAGDDVVVLVHPELFAQYQAIARWYWQQEVANHPELNGKVKKIDLGLGPLDPLDPRVGALGTGSAIARHLFQFIKKQQDEEAGRIPQLSEDDYAAFEASIQEVLRERESDRWSRQDADLTS